MGAGPEHSNRGRAATHDFPCLGRSITFQIAKPDDCGVICWQPVYGLVHDAPGLLASDEFAGSRMSAAKLNQQIHIGVIRVLPRNSHVWWWAATGINSS